MDSKDMLNDTAGKTILIPEATLARAAAYLRALLAGSARPGAHLQRALGTALAGNLTEQLFLDELINTKVPQIFAESAVAGDGSDWNQFFRLSVHQHCGLGPCVLAGQ